MSAYLAYNGISRFPTETIIISFSEMHHDTLTILFIIKPIFKILQLLQPFWGKRLKTKVNSIVP